MKTSRHVSYAIVLPSFPADLPFRGRNTTQAGLTNRPMKYAQATEMITAIQPAASINVLSEIASAEVFIGRYITINAEK